MFWGFHGFWLNWGVLGFRLMLRFLLRFVFWFRILLWLLFRFMLGFTLLLGLWLLYLLHCRSTLSRFILHLRVLIRLWLCLSFLSLIRLCLHRLCISGRRGRGLLLNLLSTLCRILWFI